MPKSRDFFENLRLFSQMFLAILWELFRGGLPENEFSHKFTRVQRTTVYDTLNVVDTERVRGFEELLIIDALDADFYALFVRFFDERAYIACRNLVAAKTVHIELDVLYVRVLKYRVREENPLFIVRDNVHSERGELFQVYVAFGKSSRAFRSDNVYRI